MEKYYLITFENSSGAMKTERYLKAQNFRLAVMPTPTYITKSCGISIRVEEEQGEKVKQLLERGETIYKNLYKKEENEMRKIL
ncbi:DUF3343 domain-containing protein [Clostridium oryzae]|uniref:Putative Se/S carrier protein-like domain-containing protein n=1 Tax=Clostridium oryzae TaxID=1450648 RepID=A0A1V4IFA2_9CLOT|nr:DUF3343 domain-containing protein [Clostridium oryzae]OPJ58682.1 hypothetical protein CLORY_35160 [Clostridium oryzae]